MRPTSSIGRRKFLKTASAVAVAGPLLAGCTSTANSDDSNSGSANTGNGGADGTGGASSFGGWLDGTNYDGSVTDKTGASEVTVEVGAETNSGPYAFAPPAVKISTGTTIIWEWTGKGGTHNVVAKDGSFESELTDEKGHTFEHTFENSGTSKYFCAPHISMGMKGVVVK